MLRIIKLFLTTAIIALLLWANLEPRKIKLNIFGKQIQKDFRMFYGLDLQGGVELIFSVNTGKLQQDNIKDAVLAARDIIEKRINFLGVTEPSINIVKSGRQYRIQVALPGITDTKKAIQLIGNTAQLSFREMASPEADLVSTQSAALTLNQIFSKKTPLTGEHIKKAQVIFNPQTGQPEVSLTFTPEGAKLFEEITARNIGKPLAIFVDDFLISNPPPVVQQKISGGQAVISGNFSIEEAKQLAVSINSGALPVSLSLIRQDKVAPTLGKKEIERSMQAGIIGLISVIIFMLLVYKRFAIAAILSLALYALITLSIFKLIPVVLTLPGLAGFILSIGMAVDSNILIFERIKEELRKGKDYKIALNLGFGRALDAIKDANFTTLAVAFILFNPLNWDFLPQFGLIKGFALTLAIGVVISLFTGVFITKKILQFIKL